MTYAEFEKAMEKEYKRKFPQSTFRMDIIGKYVYVTSWLAENPSEEPYGHWFDMFNIQLIICFDGKYAEQIKTDKNTELPETMLMIKNVNNYIIRAESLLDTVYGKKFADGMRINGQIAAERKISYRRAEGNAEKLIAVYGRFINRLYQSLEKDIADGNILEDYEKLVSKKVF